MRTKIKETQTMKNLTRTNGKKKTGLPGWSTVDRSFDRVFDEMFRPFGATSKNTGQTNVVEHEDSFEWQVDMPGVGEDNIDVSYNQKTDTLSVSTSYEDSSERSSMRRDFRYSVRLGNEIDTDSITAEYGDGVLHVNLPKTEREETVKQIDIT